MFVCGMEDVLDVYHRPYDPRFPQLCMDETSVQLLADARQALPMRPGRPTRVDSEYVSHAACNLFLTVEPLRGWRHAELTERRARHSRLSDGGLPHRSARQSLPSAPMRCAACKEGVTNSGARRTARAARPERRREMYTALCTLLHWGGRPCLTSFRYRLPPPSRHSRQS